MNRFQDRTALITGGARGQGLAHALAFAKEGANVVLCDLVGPLASVAYALPSPADLESAREQVEAAGAACLSLVADVRDPGQMRAAVEAALARFGRVDVLCANAGICTYSPVDAMTSQTWQETIDINLTGVFNSVRAVLPAMAAAGFGRIIATGSMAGRGGQANIAHYVASKWGLIGFIKSVAMEVGRQGVTANVVAPTNVDTDMIQHQAFYDLVAPGRAGEATRTDAERVFSRMSPQGVAWVDTSDVTRAVLFLADEGSRYITGEVLHVAAGANAVNAA